MADVGSRYYTYIWTMLLAMEACAGSRLRFVVCDRPNPIGGAVEGAPQATGYLTFVGLHPIPVRHGMTAGELARLFAAERRLDLDLVVCPAAGWAREMPYAETGLPWVAPSPNMPTTDTALVYPGMCLLEGTNLSEGRGTTRPFEVFGAPWLDPIAVADALNALALPGVQFLPCRFRPMFDKHAGQACGGAQMHVTDRAAFRPFQTGLRVIETLRRLGPIDFRWRTEPYEYDDRPAIDLLTGSERYREIVERGGNLRAEIARHFDAAQPFFARREPFLLYPDRKPAVVAFVGGHDSGKTSIIVEVLPRLKARGLTVGVGQAHDQGCRRRRRRQGLAAARGGGRGGGSLRHAAPDDRAPFRGGGDPRARFFAATSPTATSSSSKATSRCRSRRSRSCGPGSRGPTSSNRCCGSRTGPSPGRCRRSPSATGRRIASTVLRLAGLDRAESTVGARKTG